MTEAIIWRIITPARVPEARFNREFAAGGPAAAGWGASPTLRAKGMRNLIGGGLFRLCRAAGEIFAEAFGNLLQSSMDIFVHRFDHVLYGLALRRLIVLVSGGPNGRVTFGVE